MNSENIPFVEKYRPKILDDTVLDSLSRTILEKTNTNHEIQSSVSKVLAWSNSSYSCTLIPRDIPSAGSFSKFGILG